MDDFQKLLDKTFRFLSFRPRSEKEIRVFLQGKHATDDISQKILDYLTAHNYINDEEFAKWWIEQRTKFKAKGPRLIVLELKQKGVPQEIIERVFENQESGSKNQGELAKQIIEKKLPKYKSLPKQEIYKKLGAALARRGFDWETIKRAIDEVLLSKV